VRASAYTVSGNDCPRNQRASVRSGEVLVQAGRLGRDAGDVRVQPDVRVEQFELREGEVRQVHAYAAVPERERQGQAGVHVEPSTRAGDQDVARRSQRGEQRRGGQRERTRIDRRGISARHATMIAEQGWT